LPEKQTKVRRMPAKIAGNKRRILLCLFLLSTIHYPLSAVSYAAPCYGTHMPEKKKISMGLEMHSIFKRYLRSDYGKLRSSQWFLLLSYGVWDWLSIDLKGGAGNVKQHPVGADEIDYSTGFAGGYGLRLRLLETHNWKAVFGFQHISVHPKSKMAGTVKNRAILDDWQTSLVASYDFKRFVPYLGTRWSRIDYIHWTGDDRKRVMSDLTRSYGLIVGTDVTLFKNIRLNLEGSFFDSEALAFSFNYDF
jgi:hypothetical protein